MQVPDFPRAVEVIADARTLDQLGQRGAAFVTGHLWVGDCQTCGRALGERTPSLVAQDYGPYVEFSLNHLDCRGPQWADRVLFDFGHTMTYLYRPITIPLPDTRAATMRPVATVLMNPGIERVRMTREPRGTWTLYRRRHDGFLPMQGAPYLYDNRHARVTARPRTEGSDQTTVEVVLGGEVEWTFGLGTIAMRRMAECGGMLLVLSSAINPASLDNLDDITLTLRDITANDTADALWLTYDP